MSINLVYYLSKNKTNLKVLCAQLNIKNYDQLVEYCSSRGIQCNISEKEFSDCIEVEKSKNVKKNTEKTVTKTRRSSRTRKTRKSGSADKKDDT